MTKEKIKNALQAEFINGKTTFDWLFLALGLLMQVAAIIFGFIAHNPDSIISMVSAIAGIISVVLCAQGKISFYIFGYIQLFTYVFGVALPNHLWGEVLENVFYFITMIYGTFAWLKSYGKRKDNNSTEIIAKKLSVAGWIVSIGTLIVGTTVFTLILKNTNDPLPFFDAISTVPAFIAQILMVVGYREQWLHWCIIDVASIVMFILLQNWAMTAMFVFWTLNCIYGWVKWSKSTKYNDWERTI